jgi:hypothetical protein
MEGFNNISRISLANGSDILVDEVDAYLHGYNNLVPVLAGPPGIGKSSVIKWTADKMNQDHYIISLGAVPYEYLSGLPEFQKTHYNGKEVNATEWTLPDVIRSINKRTEEAIKNGRDGLVVLLDDIHLMEPAAQKYMFEFFQNKTLQNFKLHERATLVGAMNDSASAGLEGFYSAIIDRISLYFVEFDYEFWYRNIGIDLHPIIAAFAKSHDGSIKGSESKDEVTASPRSFSELSDFLTYLTEVKKIDQQSTEFKNRLSAKAKSTIGIAETQKLIEFFNSYIKYDFQKILDEKQVDYEIPDDHVEQILTAFIIRSMKTKEQVDTVLEILFRNKEKSVFFSTALSEIAMLIQTLPKVKDKNKKATLTYIKKEILAKRDPEVLSAFTDSMGGINE